MGGEGGERGGEGGGREGGREGNENWTKTFPRRKSNWISSRGGKAKRGNRNDRMEKGVGRKQVALASSAVRSRRLGLMTAVTVACDENDASCGHQSTFYARTKRSSTACDPTRVPR